MTVKELKEKLELIDDDSKIVMILPLMSLCEADSVDEYEDSIFLS